MTSRLFFILRPAALILAVLSGSPAARTQDGSQMDQTLLFRTANAAFESREYAQAVSDYSDLIAAGKVSPDLYYNLGVSEYRLGNLGNSVLWLRRALLLDRGLDEAGQNLEFLRAKVAFLEFGDSKLDRFLRGLAPASMRIAHASCWWLALIAVAAVVVIRRLRQYRTALVASAIFMAAAGFGISKIQKYRQSFLAPESFAIVTSPAAIAVTAPAPDSKKVIDLPPGSELRILEEAGPWRYVEIPGDLRGWVRAEVVTLLWPVPEPSTAAAAQ
jgi:tetratricopeptide (TPR) repeat protein